MDTASASFANQRPAATSAAVSADALSPFPLSSSGLGQITPRFAGDRLSPGGASSIDTQRSYSNTPVYYSRENPLQERLHPSAQHQQEEQWSTLGHQLSYAYAGNPPSRKSESSTTPPYSSFEVTTSTTGGTTAAESARAVQASEPAVVSPVPATFPAAAADPYSICSQTLGQMNVSLARQVSLGGQTSLIHGTLAHSPPLNHSPLHQAQSHGTQIPHWGSVRPVYTDPGPYHQRSPGSPAIHEGHFAQHSASSDQPTMTGNSGNGGHGRDFGGFGEAPGSHQGQQHHQNQHHPHQDQSQGLPNPLLQNAMLQTNHGGMSQQGGLHRNNNSGSTVVTTADDAMAYRHPTSMIATTASGYPPKLSSVPSLQSQSPYPVYHHQSLQQQQQQQQDMSTTQHGLASPADGLRIIPPLLPSQGGLPGMASPMGYPTSPGVNRGYSYHQQAPPGPMSGPVMSNMGNPGGQLTMFAGAGMGYGPGRKPLLYSNSHHMHPSLSPTQMGHPGMGKGPLSAQDRPFKCDECPQSFNRNHDLKRHKRIHLAVKPFPCNYCDKSFSRKDALKRHRLVKGCGEKVDVPPSNAGFGPGSDIKIDHLSDEANEGRRLR